MLWGDRLKFGLFYDLQLPKAHGADGWDATAEHRPWRERQRESIQFRVNSWV